MSKARAQHAGGLFDRPGRLLAGVETGLQPLRDLQSGHPGDYVVWLTTGASAFGLLVVFFLRR